jgi:hypothetical protein
VKRSGLGFVFVLSLLAACRTWERQQPPIGGLEAHWTGADSGKIAAHADAEWCGERRLLEVRAIRGDTGLAVALYPVDTIVSDSYPVVEPTRADSTRPSASVALRLFASTAIKGYQGDSGSVLLERSSSGQLSGSLTARVRLVRTGEAVRLSGKFEHVAVVAQEQGCTPEPPDTSDDAVPDDEEVD